MRTELIAIGTSLGGLNALLAVVRHLPRDLPAAIVVVQHRGATHTTGLVDLLQESTALTVVEPEDKTALKPGMLFVAPADYHLLVEDRESLALSTDAPVRSARPSIDVLFESAADAYGDAVARNNLDSEAAHAAAELCQHFVALVALHAV